MSEPASIPAVTVWNRLEPRPRSKDLKASLRAEVRDPLWFLTRQWQLGELRGEDAASPAFMEVVSRNVALKRWMGHADDAVHQTLQSAKSLESQALAEHHSADFSTRAELGQVFFRALELSNAEASTPISDADIRRIKEIFRVEVPLPDVDADASPFDPVEGASRRFASVLASRGTDGVAVHGMATPNPPVIPSPIVDDDEKAIVAAAYVRLDDWVKRVFGTIVQENVSPDSPSWESPRLDYSLRVTAGPDAAPEAVTLLAKPDTEGSLEWSSFQVGTTVPSPFAGATSQTKVVGPSHVRFPGMPAPRYWDFEDGSLSFADITPEKRDLQKLLFIDFGLVAGIDWFVIPLTQQLGTMTKVDSVVVRDVFGGRTTIDPAAPGQPGPSRWTMFSVSAPNGSLADFLLLPPTSAPVSMTGPILEEVRFARDEMANLAWAIEGATESRIGEPRPGHERDAVAEPSSIVPPGLPVAPLRYLVETDLPAHWVPLVAVPIEAGAGAVDLVKGTAVRNRDGERVAIPSLGRILNHNPYVFPEEEIPRAGLRVERVVCRARGTDGASHLWVQRRRRTGTGETRSGLKFDVAIPTGP